MTKYLYGNSLIYSLNKPAVSIINSISIPFKNIFSEILIFLFYRIFYYDFNVFFSSLFSPFFFGGIFYVQQIEINIDTDLTELLL
ncbi:MAG: hypothetical protein CSB55_07690 [Candidatus Cloacimonadota bacterium]|nr:MAG: hypothetical protein CSB55_07690 [Candidatus Cloacimonadota bacterium]